MADDGIKRRADGTFAPGNPKPPGSGRKKGSGLTLKGSILEAMDNVHPRGRLGYLEALARTDPKTFATLAAKILPTEIQAELTKVEEKVVEIRDYATPVAAKENADAETSGSAEAEEAVEPIVH